MIRVRYTANDPNEVWLDGGTRAAAAEPYIGLDQGQGGVTFGDLKEADITTLGEFAPGDEVFIESQEPDDILDDSDPTTEAASRIYWRAVVLAPEEPG